MTDDKPTSDGILITFGHSDFLERVKGAMADVEIGMDSPDLILLAGIFENDLLSIVRSACAYRAQHDVQGPVVILTFEHASCPRAEIREKVITNLVTLLQREGFCPKTIHKE